MDENEFEKKLKELCDLYDEVTGEWPESRFQGQALFEFYNERKVRL